MGDVFCVLKVYEDMVGVMNVNGECGLFHVEMIQYITHPN